MKSTIVLGTVIIFSLIAVGDRLHAEPPYKTASGQSCTPIARVLQRSTATGKIICSEDGFRTSPATRILCFSTGEIIPGSELSTCIASRSFTRPCSSDGSNCPKPKGPIEVNEPTILYPYSSTLLNNKPTFRWREIPGATTYTFNLIGPGVSWRKMLDQKTTTLIYPDDAPAMQYGNAYRVTVVASQQGSPISASETVFTLVDATTAAKVANNVKLIRQLSLPEDETVLDLDAIFTAHGLFTETIDSLISRVSAGSQSPQLFRLLGDRFLDVGLPTYAEKNYMKAKILAKAMDDRDELEKINQGLQAVNSDNSWGH